MIDETVHETGDGTAGGAAGGTGARGTRGEQARATKERLTRVALRLFAERGYAATSTKMIARAAGVSEGVIFHHFSSKLELLLGVVVRRDVLAGRIQELLASGDDLTAADLVQAVTAGFVAMLGPDGEEARLFRVMLCESLVTPELSAAFQATSDAVISAVATHLRGRVARGELRRDLDPSTAASTLIGALLWFFLTHQELSPRQWQDQAPAYAAQVSDQWLRGALATHTLVPGEAS